MDVVTSTNRLRFKLPYFAASVSLTIAICILAQNPSIPIPLYLILWILSVLLILSALIPRRDIHNWWVAVKDSLRKHRQEWLFVIAISVIGCMVRVVWLDTFPQTMPEDEAYFALEGAEINTIYHWRGTPFTDATVFKFPRLFNVFQATVIGLLGQSVAAARLPSVILGVLALSGTYLAARWMFDRRTASLAIVFLTFLPVHIQFSRLGINQSMDITFTIWFIAFMVIAFKTTHKMAYGLTGVMLGLSQYGYLAATIMLLLVVLYTIHSYAFTRRQYQHPKALILITVITAGTVFAPQLYSRLRDGNLFHSRIGQVAIWEAPESSLNIASNLDRLPEFLWQQVAQSFMSYVNVLDAGPFYGKFEPFLGWIAPIFFFIGVWRTLRSWRNPDHMLINAWWISTTIFGGVLVVNPPEYQRLVVAVPALAILVAVGVTTCTDAVVKLLALAGLQRLLPLSVISWLLALTLISALAISQFKSYVIDYRATNPFFDFDDRNRILDDVSDKVLPLLRGYKVWFLSERAVNMSLPWSPVLHYKNPYVDGIEFRGSVDELVSTLEHYQGKQAVIIVPTYPNFVQIVDQLTRVSNMQLQQPFWDLKRDKPSVIVFASPPQNP